jgi:hypothetical protein
MSFKLRYFSTFFVVKYQRETSHARLSGRTHTLYRNIKTTKMPRCLAFVDRRKEYCSGQRLFHTYFMVRVLIIEDSTLTENCRTAIKALFFSFNLCLSVKLDNLMFIYIHIFSYQLQDLILLS